MSHRFSGARPLAATIGVALSLTLLSPTGFSPATAAPAEDPATATAQNSTTTFTDVRPGRVFYDEITWLAQNKISNGWTLSDGTKVFRPSNQILRDQMAAFMYRLAGSPAYTPPAVSKFSDVHPGQAFYKEISWLADQGISTGWAGKDGKRIFGPYRPVLRDQMAAFMYRLSGSPYYTAPSVSRFTDAVPGKTFYKEISWLAENQVSGGWSTARGKEYRPSQAVLRDQMAAFMYRLNNGGHLDHYQDGQPLELTGTALTPGEVGKATSWTITATGGTQPYTYSRTAGSLPAGITFDPRTGQLTGTPERAGDYELSFKVTDAAGASATTTVILTVNERNLDGKAQLTSKSLDTNYHSTSVVKPDGTVWEWTPDQSLDGALTPTKREGISNITQTVVGAESTLVLRSDGTVWGWGWNSDGELANPDVDHVTTVPVRVGGLTDVVQIASAGRANFALKSDGTVWAWGSNEHRMLGVGSTDTTLVLTKPVRLPTIYNIPIASLEVTENAAYAVTREGAVWAWGANYEGQLGISGDYSVQSPRQIYGLSGVKSMAAGPSSAYALKRDGTVWHMGQRDCATHPDGAPIISNPAQKVTDLTGVASMAVGVCSSFAVTEEGAVLVSGRSRNGADLGTGSWYEPTFTPVPGLPAIRSVTANHATYYNGARAGTYATATDGRVWGWGFLGPYHSRDGGNGLVTTPTPITH